MATLEDHLVRFLRGEPLRLEGWQKVPRKALGCEFKLVRSTGLGESLIISVKNNTAEIVEASVAASILRQFLLRLPEEFADCYLTQQKCRNVIDAFRASKPHFNALPKLVGFKSDPELVMNRLDFDPTDCTVKDIGVRAPTFAAMMARTTNSHALMARIGSIFDPKADRKQATWVFGPPDCGKSQLIYALQQMTHSFAVLGAMDYLDKNFKAQLLNKRIAIVQEASAAFIRHDVFKSLTGDGVHSINQKYCPVFNAGLPVLIFAMSNDAPEIPKDDSLMRRVIACKMSSLPKGEMRPESEIQALIKSELPDFIGACFSEYALLEPGSRIPSDDDDLLEAIETYEESYTDWLANHVYEDPKGQVSLRQLNQLLIASKYVSSQEQGRIKRVLMSRYKVKKRQISVKREERAVTIWIYEGISLLKSAGKLVENYAVVGDDVEVSVACGSHHTTPQKSPVDKSTFFI